MVNVGDIVCEFVGVHVEIRVRVDVSVKVGVTVKVGVKVGVFKTGVTVRVKVFVGHHMVTDTVFDFASGVMFGVKSPDGQCTPAQFSLVWQYSAESSQ
jgi:hypothetical protein